MPRSVPLRTAFALGSSAALVLTLGACSGTAHAAAGAASSATSAGPASSGPVQPLVVYSAQGYDSAVTDAFTKATGIPVKLDDDSTGPLLTKVQAEKNNPQWDVLWVDGDTAFAALDTQGMLASYTPSAAFTSVGQALQPKDHSYVPVSTTVMAAAICNAAQVSTMPTSYNDLLGAAFKDKVGMNDPSQSGPTYPFVAGMMAQLGGEDQGKAYFTNLKHNGLKVFPTNGDTLHALETGQISCGLIQSSAATGEVLKTKATSTFDPKIVYLPKTTLLPGVIGIDKAASPTLQKEAQQFVDFVLSPAGQQAMQGGDASGDSLYWPIVSGVSPLSSLPGVPDYQTIDPYTWGPKEGEVNTWFDATIK